MCDMHLEILPLLLGPFIDNNLNILHDEYWSIKSGHLHGGYFTNRPTWRMAQQLTQCIHSMKCNYAVAYSAVKQRQNLRAIAQWCHNHERQEPYILQNCSNLFTAQLSQWSPSFNSMCLISRKLTFMESSPRSTSANDDVATPMRASRGHSTNQSMVQQLTSDGNIRHRALNALPTGLIQSTMWRLLLKIKKI